MNVLIIILLVLAGLIALLLVLALWMKKEHYVKRSITIRAPKQKVFDFLKFLKNQDVFNKHAMAGTDREKTFKGTDGTVGYIYAWSGDKNAGVGEKEITRLVEGERVEAEIRFVKPMVAKASIVMEMESLSDNETKLTWSNAGTLQYPINLFIPMMQRHVAKDMDSSLLTLKNLLEK